MKSPPINPKLSTVLITNDPSNGLPTLCSDISDLVGCISDIRELSQLSQHFSDAVVVVSATYGAQSLDGIKWARRYLDDTPLVVMADSQDPFHFAEFLEAGAQECLPALETTRDSLYRSLILAKTRMKIYQNAFGKREPTHSSADTQIDRRTDERYRELFENMGSGVAIFEAEEGGKHFVLRGFNRSAERIENVRRNEVLGKRVEDVFPGVNGKFALIPVLREVYKKGIAKRHGPAYYEDKKTKGWRETTIYRLSSGELIAVYDEITDRIKAEKQLRQSRERLKVLFEFAPDAMYINDLRGTLLDGNKAAEEMVGYNREEMIGKSLLEIGLLPRNGVHRALSLLGKGLMGKPTGPDEFILKKKNGETVETEIRTFPITVDGKRLVLGIAREITSRKRAERALRESERKYRSLFDNMSTGFAYHRIITDDSGRAVDYVFLEVNDAFCRILQTPSERFLNRKATEIFPGIRNDDFDWIGTYGRVARKGIPIRFEAWFAALEKWFAVAAYSPGAGHFAVTFEDITAKKKHEMENQRYADIVNNMQVGLHVYRLEDPADSRSLRMIMANTASAELTGIPVEGVVGKTLDENFPYLRNEKIPQRYAEVARSGEGTQFEKITYEDERVASAVFSVKAFPLPERCVGVAFEDVTNRVRMEQELRHGRDLVGRIMDTSPAGILILGLDGEIEFANTRAKEIFRLPDACSKEFYQRSTRHRVTDYEGNEIPAPELPFSKIPSTGNPLYGLRNAIQWLDGSRTFLTVNAAPFMEEEGLSGVVCTIEDCTSRVLTEIEKNRLREQLQQAQKMEAIGQLAGGIAHDFNNVLGGIVGYADLLRIKLSDDPKLLKYAHSIISGSTRAADLTRQLLTFARKARVEFRILDLNEVLAQTVSILEHTIYKNISLDLDFGHPSIAVVGDAAQLENVFLNLAINSRDAMPEGGRLGIECKEVRLRADSLRGEGFEVAPGAYACVKVSDNGEGMDENVREKVFEPFFTTKEQGKGTGLGLASAYGAVKQHHGYITVQSRPGSGTVFSVYLPISDKMPSPKGPNNAVDLTGSGRILVVDDEVEVREAASEMLTEMGYTVETCEDGLKAVEVFKRNASSYNAVILDLIMPGLGGIGVFTQIKEVCPDIRVIIISGYADHPEERLVARDGADGFLEKPFRIDELAGILKAALETDNDEP